MFFTNIFYKEFTNSILCKLYTLLIISNYFQKKLSCYNFIIQMTVYFTNSFKFFNNNIVINQTHLIKILISYLQDLTP